jgi:cysteine desulfurase/selenocysteine lyase
MFSFPAPPNLGMVSGLSQLPAPAPPPAAHLQEDDFRAIAASLAHELSFAPPLPPSFPPLKSAAPSLDGEGAGFRNAGAEFPLGGERFSFPGVPSMTSVPPTGPPGGSDLAAAKGLPGLTSSPVAVVPPTTDRGPVDSAAEARNDPWSAAPNFPEQNQIFGFPRVPGISLSSAPEPAAAQPVKGEPPYARGVVPAALPPEGSQSAAAIPQVAPPAGAPHGVVRESDEGLPHPLIAAPKMPAVSQMFSFPGVPGAQSAPGVPVPPASWPDRPADEGELRSLSSERASAFPVVSQLPAVRREEALTQWADPFGGGKKEPHAPFVSPAQDIRSDPRIVPGLELSPRPLDPHLIRRDFPILQERIHGRQLIWLDNAATTQKPNAVIDRLSAFYRHENSNIHRAAHTLAARATDAYESAREKVRRFLHASSTREIIFVRGTTEGINLISQAWGRRNVEKDDEVVITWLEHHANIVPWQQLCAEKGARLRVAPVNDRGEVILEEYEKLLGPRTRIVSFSQVSNALGTVTPARAMVEMAHRHGARVVVDGAQAVSHMRVDVQALDCDFYVFSGHKIFGPTGIGAVYGRSDLLDTMPPWQGGGNMIADVTFEQTTYQLAPARFEAGTGNIADAVGLGAALDYVEQVGIDSIAVYEHELLIYATAGLLTVPGLRLIGTAQEKAGVLSFVLDGVRTEEVGAALSQEGIAVRAGHHCAQPILRRMGVEASVRPSLAFYNLREEIDALVSALLRFQANRGYHEL